MTELNQVVVTRRLYEACLGLIGVARVGDGKYVCPPAFAPHLREIVLAVMEANKFLELAVEETEKGSAAYECLRDCKSKISELQSEIKSSTNEHETHELAVLLSRYRRAISEIDEELSLIGKCESDAAWHRSNLDAVVQSVVSWSHHKPSQ